MMHVWKCPLALSIRYHCSILALTIAWGILLAAFGVELSAKEPDQALAVKAAAQLRQGDRAAAAATLRGIEDHATRNRFFAAIASAGSSPSDDTTNSGQTLPASPAGSPGGGAADFESLIELIQTTVSPTSWDATGGPGAISEFAGGVYVDPEGVLQKTQPNPSKEDHLQALREEGRAQLNLQETERAIGGSAALRFVSLPRLEQEIVLRKLAGKPLDEDMLVLAGLSRIEYVFVYPDRNDVVIAGPAESWQRGADGRPLLAESGRPVLLLEDFVEFLRRNSKRSSVFGCSITPRQANLAKTQRFLATNPMPAQRGKLQTWLTDLQSSLGRQRIDVFGLNPRSRAAQVLVEADYHMKLVGLGAAEGVPGVENYFDAVEGGASATPPAMSVLRWWFTMNYESVEATAGRDAFAINGPGVQVLSENELLSAQGERIHTGQSDEPTARFAASFTANFDALGAKYPIYADLRNMFDLALVASLLEREEIFAKIDWEPTGFTSPGMFPTPQRNIPKEVDSLVAEHRYERGRQRHYMVAVSGGVSADPREVVGKKAVQVVPYERFDNLPRRYPENLTSTSWYWDATPATANGS